uniref:Uncharacterized protein n=1 Tax=Sparus aurata TaxID=8175 RepID=A0A671U6E5_SPAAU
VNDYIRFLRVDSDMLTALGARNGPYANARGYHDDEKAGVYADVGVGKASAKWSVFDAEAKGPNAAAGAEITRTSAQAMAKAELVGASASAGPLKAEVGLGVNTGVSIGSSGVETKVLGTGVSIGREVGVSLLGSEIKFKLW